MKSLTFLLCSVLLALPGCDGQASTFFNLSQEAAEAGAPDLSAARARVTDNANILGESEEQRITDQLQDLEKELGHQMVVVTVPTLNGEPIEEYTLKLANRWGVGRRQHNDGVVVLVAPNERKVRIEVGTGLEPIVTNSFAATVIKADMIPKFRKGDYEGAIGAGVTTLIARLHTRRSATLPEVPARQQ